MRVRDIIHAARKIVLHCHEMDYEQFVKDEWTVDAVLRNFTVIGEAARLIPEDVRIKYIGIPWRDMADMRNLIVHEYFGVDLETVWRTIQADLPSLLEKLEYIIAA
jgi:uncharacterized protein with HEPN domain